MDFQKNYMYFSNREGRAGFIANVFKKEIAEANSILDVGCDYNTLKKIVGKKVMGVDLYGTPDFKVNFEKEKLSRFKNREFDFVVCTEVLEHLENFYEMIDELVRVSNRYTLISLPNCMSLFARLGILFWGNAGKFYGLPFEKPVDRHRWFFSHNDIDRFFQNYTQKHALNVSRKFLHYNFSNSWRGTLVRAFVKAFNVDTVAQSYWILLEKK